jgi:hypothetical protein
MKTKMSKQILFLAALGCMAAPVAAQTVDVTLQCGQSYTIKSTVDASVASDAEITYRWLENGSTITNATAASYTVSAKSVGIYTYIRQAMTVGCPDWQSSNAFTVQVKNKEGIDGVCIGGAMWAKYNVDVPGSFTTSPGEPGMLYKWDNLSYWPGTGPFDSWTDEASTATTWQLDNDPCPAGWRVPSAAMFRALRDETPKTSDGTRFGIPDVFDAAHANIPGFWYGRDALNPSRSFQNASLFFPTPTLSPDAPPALSQAYWAREENTALKGMNMDTGWQGTSIGGKEKYYLHRVRCVYE